MDVLQSDVTHPKYRTWNPNNVWSYVTMLVKRIQDEFKNPKLDQTKPWASITRAGWDTELESFN